MRYTKCSENSLEECLTDAIDGSEKEMGAKVADPILMPRPHRAATDWRSIYIITILTFLGAIQMTTLSVNFWPYLKSMDSQGTETFFGYMRSTASIGNMCAAVLAGYCSNLLSDTKPAMIIGKMLAIVACFLYLSVEVFSSGRRFVLLATELFVGFSMGSVGIARAHVAQASTETDRSKAISTVSLAVTIGVSVGPLLSIAFSMIGFPGAQLPFGIHLSLYTAPGFLVVCTSIAGILLLVFCFHGRMDHIKDDTGADHLAIKKPIDKAVKPKAKFDKVAVLLCLLTRIGMGMTLLVQMTLSGPYLQAAFQWTGQDLVFYNSISHGLSGLMGVAWSLAYMLRIGANRIPERWAVMAGISIFAIFYLITFPWPFLTRTIAYEVLETVQTGNGTYASVVRVPGCSSRLTWCSTTPAVNVWVYNIAQVLCVGMAMPLWMINLDSLYSKILGPIKQGTWQGIFLVAGDILNVAGPLVMSYIYTQTGPRYIWMFEIAVFSTLVLLWAIFYKRMVPYSQRCMAAEPVKC
ncbi:Protein Y53G8AR.7 a [Aphelenchoides avenae]|nr:Protein Y53G8AR.7 a [Aphelenchus avenae]